MMWKDIKGYEGMYQVSDTGLVKSLERHVENGSPSGMILPERIMKQTPTKCGYMQVSLSKNNIREIKYVHRLVADAYLAVSFGPTVNHIDGNKQNNNARNLEYVSYAENNQCAYDTGLHKRNEDHYKAKLTNDQVKEIKDLGKFTTYREIADKYNVSSATIRDIIVGKTWKNID